MSYEMWVLLTGQHKSYLALRFGKKELSLSDCNKTQTHNHLVCKQTLNNLAKQDQIG